MNQIYLGNPRNLEEARDSVNSPWRSRCQRAFALIALTVLSSTLACATENDAKQETRATHLALDGQGDYGLELHATVAPREGSMLTIDWSAPAGHGDGDWIALYPAGATDDGAYLAFARVGSGGETVGDVQLPLPAAVPGPFEARYLLASTHTSTATVSIDTRPIGTFVIALDGTVLPRQGSLATINWTAPSDHSAQDWIALYPVGATQDGAYLAVGAVGGSGDTNGQVQLALPAAESGPFEARYLLASTYTRAALARVETRPFGPISLTPGCEIVDSMVTIRWTAPSDHSAQDWIALYPVGATQDSAYVAFAAVGHGGESNGQAQLPLPATASGPLEARYLLESTHTRAASALVDLREMGSGGCSPCGTRDAGTF